MKRKFLFLSLFLVAILGQLQAQSMLQGKVTDADTGEPLIGVNVYEKGTTNGTISDIEGNYSFQLSQDEAVVVFSFIGFKKQEIPVSDQETLDVSLVPDAESLDEVVVVGYGTRKKSHSTGAISSVEGSDVAAVQATRVDEALAGKLSGVLIQNQDGAPGADPKIQIRGASSISGESNPLVVVDGFPISGSIATVNPNDIESMEILKDAASAAIYGSRGANGVILITTKKGKTGKPSFSYNTYLSTSSKYRDDILMSGPEWAVHARNQIADGNWDLSQVDPEFVEYRLNAYEESPGAISPEEWLFQNGSSMNHDFSMSGGTEDVKYFASVGYQDSEGVVITQAYEKINSRLNIDANLGEKLKAGISFNGFASKRDMLGHEMRDLLRAYGVHPIYHTEESIEFVQQLNAQAQALGLASFDDGYRGSTYEASSIYDLEPGMAAQDWHYGRANNGIGGSGDAGPAAKLDNTDRWEKTFFANVSSYLEYSIIDGLSLKTVLGGDRRDTKFYEHRLLGFDSRARTSETYMNQTDLEVSSVLSVTTLDYSKVIGKHDISAVAGMEFQTTTLVGNSLAGVNVPDTDIQNYNLFNPADITVTERDETRSRESLFGRVNYAYDNRYLASVSVRRDGDSRFGANKKYETFPALSLGWNVHSESFFQDNPVLSQLKLRFSTGSLGTTSFLGSYDALSLLDPQATIYGTGYLIPENVANPDLTWQSNTETNYGINLGFMDQRFRLGVDYYTSDIEDILINQSVSEVLGTTSIVLNSGDVRSSGWEFELNGALIRSGDFSWSFNANLSTVNTEIRDLGGLEELPQAIYGQSGRGPVFRNYVGGEIGEMWGLETLGEVEMLYLDDGTRYVNNSSGESYVIDQNGDGIIDNTRSVEDGGDLVKLGSNNPDFYWGMTHDLSYKNFDMSLQFQGSQGAEIYNVDPLYYESQWGGRLVDSFDANNDGIADHNGEYYIANRYQTDAMIQDASYIALRNLTIGYTFNDNWVNRIGLSSVRAYLASTNLLYIMADNYTSYNPEGIMTDGSDYLGPTTYGAQVGASPIVRSFTVGLNINF